MSFDPPKSRNEAILQNMLGANNALDPPKSRVEELLLQILQQGGTGGGVTPEQIAAAVEAYLEEHPVDVEPFEIPITQSGSTYSTTATAADILANKDDCAIALDGGAIRIPLDYYTVSSGITYLFFGTTSLVDNPPHIVNLLVQVSGNTVSVSQAEYTIRSVPAVTASDNGKSLVVENGAWGKGYQAARIPRVAMTASDTTPTLDPNKLYVFPEMASLTPTLNTPSDNTIVNEYHFCFDSGATATVLTLPASVLQPDGFTVEANMHYEISILEGAMTAQGWAVSA